MSKYNITIDGLTFEEWDKRWIYIGKLNIADIKTLNGEIGLYKIGYKGLKQNVYIGKATESDIGKNGQYRGLYKRLNDYIRCDGEVKVNKRGEKIKPKSLAHRYIHKNKKHLDVWVMKLGQDIEARAKANGLESLFIDYYQPKYNNHK